MELLTVRHSVSAAASSSRWRRTTAGEHALPVTRSCAYGQIFFSSWRHIADTYTNNGGIGRHDGSVLCEPLRHHACLWC